MDIDDVHEDTNVHEEEARLRARNEDGSLERILDDLAAIRESLNDATTAAPATVDGGGARGATERKVMTVRQWRKLYRADRADEDAETVADAGGS